MVCACWKANLGIFIDLISIFISHTTYWLIRSALSLTESAELEGFAHCRKGLNVLLVLEEIL